MLAALVICMLPFRSPPGPPPVVPQAALLPAALLPAAILPAAILPAAILPAAMTDADMATLHKRLMDKVEAMDRSSQGIFNSDITALAAPYFPAGQPMAETAAILRDQKIGELMPYRGKTGPGDGTMFAARFDLIGHAVAHTFIVLHFAYRRAADGGLVLDHMRAYLRSQAM